MGNYDITESVEVLPCPFRKHRKERRPRMHHIKNRNYESGMYAVICPVCGIRGMYALTEERAIMNWNSRNETDIVRCKDCAFYDDYTGCCTRRDYIAPMAATPDGFCAWGERRELEAVEVWNQCSADDVTCSEET